MVLISWLPPQFMLYSKQQVLLYLIIVYTGYWVLMR